VNLWGLSSASEQLDAQYAHEATAYGLLATLAGVDEIYSMGLLGNAQILSLDKMVLDNHLARQMGLMSRPLLVDEEHLQADLIERVGIGGHYLGQRETRTYTRREYVQAWPPADGSLLNLVHEEALELLNNHRPPALPRDAEAEIEAIVAEADQELIPN
jgi:trimethylamine---corrinoid protein Co-methyltransferase